MVFTDYLKQSGLSILSLSKLTGIPYATLHKGIEQPGSLKADNLFRLSTQLSLPMDEVYEMLEGSKPSGVLHQTLTNEQAKNEGLYSYTQTQLAYHSAIMEGVNINLDIIKDIQRTGRIDGSYKVSDIVFVSNIFRVFDMVLSDTAKILSLQMIEHIFIVMNTPLLVINVAGVKRMLSWYNSIHNVTFSDILKLHVHLVKATSSGVLARMISFKECLKANLIPFVIDSDYKAFYERGIDKYEKDSTFFSDVCLIMQENFIESIKEYEGEELLKQLLS